MRRPCRGFACSPPRPSQSRAINPPPDPIDLIARGVFSSDPAKRKAARTALGAHPDPRVSAYFLADKRNVHGLMDAAKFAKLVTEYEGLGVALLRSGDAEDPFAPFLAFEPREEAVRVSVFQAAGEHAHTFPIDGITGPGEPTTSAGTSGTTGRSASISAGAGRGSEGRRGCPSAGQRSRAKSGGSARWHAASSTNARRPATLAHEAGPHRDAPRTTRAWRALVST